MVQRYQQGQLASPVTGTPGVDQSAGVVEKQIATSAQQMQAQKLQAQASERALNVQNLQQAEQNFNQATNAFNYISEQAAIAQRRQAALDKAQEDEQRRLQAQFDRIDEDDRMSNFVGGLKAKYGDNPQQAVADFQAQVPVMRQEFQDRHKDDQQKLRMLMPSQRAAESSSLSDLQSWARTTKNQNLGKRLSLMPEQLSNRIDSLSGNMLEQLQGYQKALKDTNGVYDSMRLSTVSQADHDEIYTKQLQLNHDAAKQFADHLVAQTPDGEEGLKYIDSLKTVFEKPLALGIAMSSADQKTLLEQLHSQRNAHEQDVITTIKGDSDIRILDANRIKADLISAADNPSKLHQLSLQVQDRFKTLDQQIALVSKEPDSKVRNAKLAGLKSEQNAFINEMGLDLKLVRSFEQIQRSVTTWAQGQLKFQQGQMMFLQRQEDRQHAQEQKAVDEARAAKAESFNALWADTLKSLQSAWSEPAGTAQQQKISKIVNEAIPRLDSAMSAGIIGVDSYRKYNDELTKATKDGAAHKTNPPGWFGLGGGTVTLKGDALKKAQDTAEAQLAGVRKLQQEKFSAVQSSIEHLSSITTSKLERTTLTQYLTANLPILLESKGYKALSPADQAKRRASAVRQMVESYRKGELK